MTSPEQSREELRERFYQSVAETLTLLHTAPGYDRVLAMKEVVRILSTTMNLPLVWIGRRESARADVQMLACAGPASAYLDDLRLTVDEHDPDGQCPVACSLRRGSAQVTALGDVSWAPWREAAQSQGFGSVITAPAGTRDGGQLCLVAYSRHDGSEMTDELLDWAQRLAEQLARFWDYQALFERNQRLSRYRDAQRTIQRALLDQPDPAAVFQTLAQALVDIAGAVAVDIFVAEGEGDMLRRIALVGPMAEAIRLLPAEHMKRHDESARSMIPTRVFMQGQPITRVRPATHSDVLALWREPPLAAVGAFGCWPIFAAPDLDGGSARATIGVFNVVTLEADAFDAEMCHLLEEIADATGLALAHHRQRSALFKEQQRQTYLALHDALTDLPNRRALDHYLEEVMGLARQYGRIVALGLLDLDDLKPINDRHGHAVGDRLLIEVAVRLRAALRDQDYAARVGGDEFVLVFDQLEREEDLDPLLARVGEALQQPMHIDGATFRLSASLGVALFPTHADVDGMQLLRLADQAMYQIKAHKRERTRWWAMPSSLEGAAAATAARDGQNILPYGEPAALLLRRGFRSMDTMLMQVVDLFYNELLMHEGVSRVLGTVLVEQENEFKQRLMLHVQRLFQPDIEAPAHRLHAMRAGLFYAACGMEEVWLLEAIEMLRDVIVNTLGQGVERDRWPLNIALQRITLQRQWQLESMRELQRRRVAVLAALNTLAWTAGSYLELIQGAVDILAAHDEVIACGVGRPDTQGQLAYEAVAGEVFATYLRALVRGEAAPIDVNADSVGGGGPSGRAWREVSIQRCAHYGSDSSMLPWRQLARQMGITSSVAIPLCPLPRMPAAVLTLYSGYPGGFKSEDQDAFVEQIRTVLDLALSRLAPPRPGAELLPFFVRERWRNMVTTDALQMHFQPVVRLADGRVTELEALARLREDDGSMLMPGRFLAALGDEELLILFREGFLQAVACRQLLADGGHLLDISVNVPAAALEDPHYVETTAAVLAASGCPPAAVLLEILESPIGSGHSASLAIGGMQALKALGVRLVEDDLGAGYSSLIRLRQWPFDRVKIDQALVLQIVDEPLRTLRFMRQLIRLGHDLDMEVVVEGLETTGLIEAALILGADLGQGYALARPMAAQVLPGWLAGFSMQANAATPVTALGALAAALFWGERLAALPAAPLYWKQHAEAICAPLSYLRHAESLSAELVESHAAMHRAAVNGPLDPTYRRVRGQFITQLIEQVYAEEKHQIFATPARPA